MALERLSDAEVRARLGDLLAPFAPERDITQVAEIRQELAKECGELARLIRLARSAELAVPANHTLAAAFATLDRLGAAGATVLPVGTAYPFGPSWQSLIDQPDRKAALGCFVAATTMVLKRALRNRSVSVDHSLSFKPPEDKLIPAALWQRDRNRLLRDLALPGTAAQFLPLLEAGLSDRLQALAAAVEAGEVAIERGGQIRRLRPVPAGGKLKSRKLHLPRGFDVPEILWPIVSADAVSRRAISRG
ncbi:hypothetical protein [Mycobacterium sp. KBS0706]|uniref:hypothetical protein n=1 Tax=Mycobacterium sp. KBS0706 TaxID=2578109 RepID=UPI0027D2C815|nr:hypothetical protein [Mycobacterium sp. KBS0706]